MKAAASITCDRFCNGILPLAIFLSLLGQISVTLYMFPGVVRMTEMDADIGSTFGAHIKAARDMTTQCTTYLAGMKELQGVANKTTERAALKQTYKDERRVWTETLEKYGETVTFWKNKVPITYKDKALGPVTTWDVDVPQNLTVGEDADTKIAEKTKAFIDAWFAGYTVTRVLQTDQHLYTLTLHGQSGSGLVRVKPSTVSDIEILFSLDKQGLSKERWNNFTTTKVPALQAQLCNMFTKMAEHNEHLVFLTMNRVTAYVGLFLFQLIVALILVTVFTIRPLHERLEALAWPVFRPVLSFFGLLFSFSAYTLFLHSAAQKMETTTVHEVVTPGTLFGNDEMLFGGESPYYLVLAWLGVFVASTMAVRCQPHAIFKLTDAEAAKVGKQPAF